MGASTATGRTDRPRSIHVLLVEDSDAEAELARRALTSEAGWSVTRARTVRDALKSARDRTYDVALLDYLLPDGTGLDVLDGLRVEHPRLPILFMTGYGSEEVAMKALPRGAVDYLVKTSDLHRELTVRVKEVIARWEDILSAARPEPVRHAKGADASASSAPRASAPAPLVRPDAATLSKVLDSLVVATTFGAAIFDTVGKPLASRLPPNIDAGTLGAFVANIHLQVWALGRIPDLQPRGYVTLAGIEGGLLAMATVPGPVLLILIMDPTTSHFIAMKRVQEAAQLVRQAGSRE